MKKITIFLGTHIVVNLGMGFLFAYILGISAWSDIDVFESVFKGWTGVVLGYLFSTATLLLMSVVSLFAAVKVAQPSIEQLPSLHICVIAFYMIALGLDAWIKVTLTINDENFGSYLAILFSVLCLQIVAMTIASFYYMRWLIRKQVNANT